ncbi:MAG: heme exporter protein CcmD [Maricaulaceae bacterium]
MLEFGKYAPYIWASYGVSALVLGALILHTVWPRK